MIVELGQIAFRILEHYQTPKSGKKKKNEEKLSNHRSTYKQDLPIDLWQI